MVDTHDFPFRFTSMKICFPIDKMFQKIGGSIKFNVFKIGFVVVSPGLREFLWVFCGPSNHDLWLLFWGTFLHQVCCQASQGKSVGQVRLKKPGAKITINPYQPQNSELFLPKKKIDANLFLEWYSELMQAYPNVHMLPSNHPSGQKKLNFP